ncbi:MAG: IS91 family transposase [Firmicutes bacterium]|nr:IS91 family transposase [Bacillota bacterium]
MEVGNKIQKIFTKHYPSYETKNKVPGHGRKAAWYIMNCRTKVLGGHVHRCPNGDYFKIQYNSCKHRVCRQCSGFQIEKWLKKQTNKVLNTDHYHIIFTIPHEFNDIWMLNTKKLTNLLFRSAKKALDQMFEDERYIGGKPGAISTLHTWGKTMILHPHIHMLVTGGGINKKGEWKSSKKGFLIPVKSLMKLFRKYYTNGLHNLLYNGEIKLPKGETYKRYHQRVREQGKQKWNVNIREKYLHGEGVIKYLGRYIKGGPISDKRIIKITDNDILIKYSDNKDNGKKKIMKLSCEEFIRRFILHIQKKGMKVIRYYGIYSPNCKEKLNRIRKKFGQEPVKEIKVDWIRYCEQAGMTDLNRCPICGATLESTEKVLPIKRNIREQIPLSRNAS